jgi:hypothetical protein
LTSLTVTDWLHNQSSKAKKLVKQGQAENKLESSSLTLLDEVLPIQGIGIYPDPRKILFGSGGNLEIDS